MRLAVTVAAYAMIGIAAALLLSLGAPAALGMRPLVVLSGSMEPALHVGDVTVTRGIRPADANVGDVVTFENPQTGNPTTHRVRSVRRLGSGRYEFMTKGDANNAVERWTLPATGKLGRTVYRVPVAGRAMLWIRTPVGWITFVVLPLLALGAQELSRIWRPGAGKADGPLAV